MPAAAATLIKRIDRAFVAEDGQHMVLQLIGDEDEEINLGIPRKQMLQISVACAACRAESDRILDFTEKEPLPVTAWELGYWREADKVVLSLTFGEGAALSFALDQDITKAIRDILIARLA